MSEKKFFIGIDFGHGETSVSRVPGYNNEPVSRVPLRVTSHDVDKKVVSAICRHDDGWHFVWTKEDFRRPDIREGFKGVISKLSPEKKEALGEFAKLIFRTILKNDPDLEYDENTGDANFSICIANPSDWRRQDPSTPGEYLRFFRDECGIKPIEICINESDAAFYTKYNDYSRDDTVFVIDLGSSTIDFTTYHHSACVPDCCWGHNLGAHLVEDQIIDKGYLDEENAENMRKVTLAREEAGLGSADAALSLAARFAKEEYFTNHLSSFDLEMKYMHFAPWKVRRDVAFSLFLSKEEFNNVIDDYSKQLEMVLVNAAKKLSDNGIKPTLVLLSGGASRMDFVRESAVKAFPGVQIYQDVCPEWVVSDGAAKYVQVMSWAMADTRLLQSEFENWAQSNLISAVQDAGLSAFQETLRECMRERLYADYVNNNSKTTVNDFESCLLTVLNTVTSTAGFKSRADEKFVEIVNAQIVSKLKDIIFNRYQKDVEISYVFVEPGNCFEDVPVETNHIHEMVDVMGYNLFCSGIWPDDEVNRVKDRTSGDRQRLVDYAVRQIPETYRYEFNGDISNWIEEAKSKIWYILKSNGLFDISM